MSACPEHPTAGRYTRWDGYTGCRECQREWRRQYRARDARPPQRSTPHKLSPTDKAVLFHFADLNLVGRRELADQFGISEARLYQLLRERREATA